MRAAIKITEDQSLPAFDFTKLTAINMCPRWGLIRYDQHKKMPGNGRSTALEMGAAAHECFAAVRLFELLEFGPTVYGDQYDQAQIDHAGIGLFGADRYAEIVRLWSSGDDVRRRVNSVAIYVANTSGYYDDPSDRRRTLSNLETAIVAYIDRSELGTRIPIVKPFIGIEVPFDVTVEFQHDGPNSWTESLRYVGRVDGVVNAGVGVEVEENKTASRLDKSWHDSFLTSHQVTGYCVALSTLLGMEISEARIRGMMVPLPKTYDMGGISNVTVSRDQWRRREWVKWLYDTYLVWQKWKDRPLDAPEYTHSCNRYFTSCSFIPLCAMADPEDRKLTFEQMEHDEWSPLAEKAHV